MKTFYVLLKTELKLSLRGMDMFIFAICMPLAVLVLLGMIYGNRPAHAGADYTFLQQSFSALTAISICAGGVMGLPLVISDYRNKKILKRYKVTPTSPAMILFVQTAIYAIYSLTSALLLFLTASLIFGYRFTGSWPGFLGSYFLVMISTFSLGMMVGGIAPNPKAAGIAASILYFPMLLFSGATLPYEILPAALQKTANLLPLTQGIKLLKSTSLGLPTDTLIPLAATLTLTALCTALSLKFFKWE